MTIPLKRLAECRDDLRRPVNATERAKMQGDIPYWGANQIQDYVDTALVDGQTVLIGEDGAPFFDRNRDVAFYVDEPIWPNNHIHVLKPLPHADPRWLAYALNSVDFSRWISGSTRDKLTQADLMRIELPSYSLGRQSSIADYLDRETATIDALIEKQLALSAALRERRTSVVNRVLDALTAPSTPLGLSVRMQTGLTLGGKDADDSGEDVPYLRVANIQTGRVDLDHVTTVRVMPDVALKHRLQAGDVLMTEGGDKAALGRGALWRGEIDPCLHQNHVFCLRPDKTRLLPEFLVWALEGGRAREYFEKTRRQTTNLSSTNSQTVKRFRFPLPPVEEQREIADHLDRETAKIDALIAKAERFIELARERRAALITAAVTGQIEIPT